MKSPIGFIYPNDWQPPSCIAVLVEPKTRDRLNDRFTSVGPELDCDDKINMLIDITEKADESIGFFRSEYEIIKGESQKLKAEIKSSQVQNTKCLAECDDLKTMLDYTKHQRTLMAVFMMCSLMLNIFLITSH